MALKKAVKKSLKVRSILTEEDYCNLAEQYDLISSQIKALDATKKDLAAKLKAGAELVGVKDDKGSYYYESPTHIFGKVAKKSFSINLDKARPILLEKGLTKSCINLVEVIDEDAVNKAYETGTLTIKDVEAMTDSKTSYSVLVKKKEEMPDIDVSALAASRRK